MRQLGLVLAALILAAPAARADDDDLGDLPDGGAALEHCQAPKDLKGEPAQAYRPACEFFTGVAGRHYEEITPFLRAPFYFEGKSVQNADEVHKRWRELLGDLGRAPAPFYGMDVYSYDEMVKKYGKPPAKLESVPSRGAVVAVANIDGRAAVAFLHREGNNWVVYAFHD